MIRPILAAAVALMLAGPAWAERTLPSEERMRELFAFAGTAMGVRHYNVDLPLIKHMSTEQMQVMIYGVEEFNRINAAPNIGMVKPRALYVPETQMMYLNRGTDYTDPDNEFELVHEFVHHLQAVHGHYDTFLCVNASEAEAYRVSNLWVMATGHGEMKDPMTIFSFSQCREDQ